MALSGQRPTSWPEGRSISRIKGAPCHLVTPNHMSPHTQHCLHARVGAGEGACMSPCGTWRLRLREVLDSTRPRDQRQGGG